MKVVRIIPLITDERVRIIEEAWTSDFKFVLNRDFVVLVYHVDEKVVINITLNGVVIGIGWYYTRNSLTNDIEYPYKLSEDLLEDFIHNRVTLVTDVSLLEDPQERVYYRRFCQVQQEIAIQSDIDLIVLDPVWEEAIKHAVHDEG